MPIPPVLMVKPANRTMFVAREMNVRVHTLRGFRASPPYLPFARHSCLNRRAVCILLGRPAVRLCPRRVTGKRKSQRCRTRCSVRCPHPGEGSRLGVQAFYRGSRSPSIPCPHALVASSTAPVLCLIRTRSCVAVQDEVPGHPPAPLSGLLVFPCPDTILVSDDEADGQECTMPEPVEPSPSGEPPLRKQVPLRNCVSPLSYECVACPP